MTAPDKIYIDRGPNGGWMHRHKRMSDTVAEYTRTDLIPTDARLVTVAQLDRWASVAAELGDVVVTCEIRTIIGENGNGRI